MLRPWQGVVCAESAHLNVDEGGAPEAMAGIKLLTTPTPDGKLTTELVERWMTRLGDEHVVQPGVVSITQSTELGTLYTVEEMAALADYAHARGMLLHVDGSRLANAAAALDVGLGDITAGAGADVVSVGGTKVGLLAAELDRRPRSVAAGRAAIPPQAVDAARVEDAVRVGAARGAADRRSVAPRREPCQRDGAAAR